MTRFMLDTNICIFLLRKHEGKIFDRLRQLAATDIGISSITIAELQFGAMKSNRPDYHVALLATFCAPLAVFAFDHSAAEVYGDVRLSLERQGTPIGPLDTLIAAHAISLDATLVTNNEREFRRVASLRVENWMK